MGNKSRVVDLNQKRAAVSYVDIDYFLRSKNIDKEKKKNMKSFCGKLPILIKTNGLLATLCFIKGKIKKENEIKNVYSFIYSWLENWLNEFDNNEGSNIIERLITINNYKYNLYTKEAIQISTWYKKHVEAML